MQDLVIEWKEDGTHLYEQIYQYIRDEIRRGSFSVRRSFPRRVLWRNICRYPVVR